MGVSKSPVGALRDFILTGEMRGIGPHEAAVAVEQGLAGLLLDGIGGRAGLVAPEVLERLRESTRRSLVRGVRLLDLAGRAQRLLLARGVRTLPLKGAALAESLYDSVAFRPMLDADLLVLDAWTDAVEALLEEGYVCAARADHAFVFVCPTTGGILELHQSITSCPGLFPASAEALWSRSLPAEGPLCRLPSSEDLLVQLSLHASFQHGLVLSLVQWLDFRRLFERVALDRDLVMQVTAEARAQAAVALALRAAQMVVGAPVPQDLLRALEPTPRVRGFWERRGAGPLCLVSPSAPPLARVRFELAEGRRLQFLASTLGCGPARGFLGTSARAVHLARRWALPSVRSWRGAVS